MTRKANRLCVPVGDWACLRPMRFCAAVLGAALALTSCKRGDTLAGGTDGGAPSASGAPSALASAGAQPASTQGQNSVAEPPPSDKPLLGITAFVATVYTEPRDTSKKLGYLRVGTKIA